MIGAAGGLALEWDAANAKPQAAYSTNSTVTRCGITPAL